MKARIRKTGEMVDVTRNKCGAYVDENCVGYNLKDLVFEHEEDAHWQDVRERAAIAAMQGTITILSNSDRYAFTEIVADNYTGQKKTFPNEIAEFSVACADALVEQLKKDKNDTTAYVVTRCEEHSDYVEKVFLDESKAQAYCDKFNNDENEYARNITKIEVTL